MKTQVFSKTLPCTLTPEEIQTESIKLIGMLREKSHLEDAKKSSNSMYAERIKAIEEQIEEQMPIVQYGQVDRVVEVLVEYHTPEDGMKRLTRQDTQEVLEIVPMTDDELQNLFINAGEPVDGEQADVSGTTPVEGSPAGGPAEDLTAEEIIDYIPEEQTTDLVCEPGKLYRVQGVTGRCRVIAQFETGCNECVFGDNCPADTEPVFWDCDTHNVTFDPYPGQQTEDSSCEQSESICTYCGAINTNTGNKILHVSGNKPVCHTCLAQKNEKYFNQVLEWHNKGHQVLFRPSFGFGCTDNKADTTCFRFMGAGHSWGCPVYKEGDYETPGTEAAKFCAELSNKENFKED